MDKVFKVRVNNSKEFDLSENQGNNLNMISESASEFHILDQGNKYRAKLLEADFYKKQYTVSVNSNTYKVNISSPLDNLIKELGFSLRAVKKWNDIKAPMPGIIIGLEVHEGDEVKEGDTLLILEAMKMENAIISPKDGKVKSVLIKPGDTVEKNKLLIELE